MSNIEYPANFTHLVNLIHFGYRCLHYNEHVPFFVNWNLMNKLQWNCYEEKKLFIHENASENIICEMAAILFGGGSVGCGGG